MDGKSRAESSISEILVFPNGFVLFSHSQCAPDGPCRNENNPRLAPGKPKSGKKGRQLEPDSDAKISFFKIFLEIFFEIFFETRDEIYSLYVVG